MKLLTPDSWLDAEFLRDPYPHYAALRESGAAQFDPEREVWLITRHANVTAILRDDKRFSAQQGPGQTMLVTDPPDHTRLRTLVSKAFTARTVKNLAPRIEAIIESLFDTIGDRKDIDIIADFAYPLPLTVIAEMMGVDQDKRDFFREASTKIAYSLGPITDPQTAANAEEGRNDLLAYFFDLIARRKANPRDDLVSALIATEEQGDMLNEGELLAMLFILLVGGHETTVNLIGNGLLALLRHPDERRRFQEDENIAPSAVEEFLRYDSPVQYTGRLVREDFALDGETIRAGERVRLILGAANRDPAVYDDPGRLDLTRSPNPHLAFGIGIHHCLGANLARLEGRMALTALLRRYPNLQLATDDLAWRPAAVLRGLEQLPVALS